MKFLSAILLAMTAAVSLGSTDVENTSSRRFFLEGYIDARYVDYGEYNAVPGRGFSLRRSGLEALAQLTENLEAELKVEARPDQIFLKDALVRWDPFSFGRLTAGQFRRTVLLAGDLSTWNLPLFERTLLHDLMEDLTYEGRDLGIDFRATFTENEHFRIRALAGVFNGDERGEERTDSELLYSLRGTVDIFPAGLTLGGSAVSHRLGMQNASVPEGYSVSSRQNAVSADLSLKRDFGNWYSASLYAEAATGRNWRYADVIAGETAPWFKGAWGTVTCSVHPWNISAVRTISLSAGYEILKENDDLDLNSSRLSLIAAVYPSPNTRVRFGGVRNTIEGALTDTEYTDIVLEAGFRF